MSVQASSLFHGHAALPEFSVRACPGLFSQVHALSIHWMEHLSASVWFPFFLPSVVLPKDWIRIIYGAFWGKICLSSWRLWHGPLVRRAYQNLFLRERWGKSCGVWVRPQSPELGICREQRKDKVWMVRSLRLVCGKFLQISQHTNERNLMDVFLDLARILRILMTLTIIISEARINCSELSI